MAKQISPEEFRKQWLGNQQATRDATEAIQAEGERNKYPSKVRRLLSENPNVSEEQRKKLIMRVPPPK